MGVMRSTGPREAIATTIILLIMFSCRNVVVSGMQARVCINNIYEV